MISRKIRKEGDYLLWKVNKKTPLPYELVAGLSKELNPKVVADNNLHLLDCYFHIAHFIDKDNIIHARPPRCTVDFVDEKFLKKESKKADLELWRFKQIKENEIHSLTSILFQIGDMKYCPKKDKWLGRHYDWPAIFLACISWIPIFRGLNAKHLLHCAEFQHDGALLIGRVLSCDGSFDSLVSPNNILSGGLLRKVA